MEIIRMYSDGKKHCAREENRGDTSSNQQRFSVTIDPSFVLFLLQGSYENA